MDQFIVCLDGTLNKATSSEQKPEPDADKHEGEKKIRRLGGFEIIRKDPVTPKVTRSGKIFDWRRYSTARGRYSTTTAIGAKKRDVVKKTRNELATAVEAPEENDSPSTSQTIMDFQNILIDELAIADNNSLYASDQSTLELRLSTDSESPSPTDLVIFGTGEENGTDQCMGSPSASLTPSTTPSTTVQMGSNMCNTDSNAPEITVVKQTHPEVESMQPEIKSTQPEVKSTQPEVKSTQPEVKSMQPEVETTKPSEESETQSEIVQKKQTGKKYLRKQRRGHIPVVIELHPSLLVSPPKYSCLKELSKEEGAENHSEKTVRWIDDKENAPLCQVQTFEQPGLRRCKLKKKLYTD